MALDVYGPGNLPGRNVGQISTDGQFIWRFNSWIPYTAPTDPTVPTDPTEPGADVYGPGNLSGHSVGQISDDGQWRWNGTGWDPYPPDPLTDDGDGGADDFSGQLAAAVAAWQRQQREVGERQAAEAHRLGARRAGHLERSAREAAFAMGRTPGEFEQLYAGAEEAGSRSLSDLIKQINLQTQRQEASGAQFRIGTMISGEQLEQRQREMMQQGSQFQQSLAEQIRQWSGAQSQQASQFQQQIGLSEDRLAEMIRQFNLSQPKWWEAPLGAVAGGLGTAFGAWGLNKLFPATA